MNEHTVVTRDTGFIFQNHARSGALGDVNRSGEVESMVGRVRNNVRERAGCDCQPDE